METYSKDANSKIVTTTTYFKTMFTYCDIHYAEKKEIVYNG